MLCFNSLAFAFKEVVDGIDDEKIFDGLTSVIRTS